MTDKLTTIIAPSILSANFAQLETACQEVLNAGGDWLQYVNPFIDHQNPSKQYSYIAVMLWMVTLYQTSQ